MIAICTPFDTSSFMTIFREEAAASHETSDPTAASAHWMTTAPTMANPGRTSVRYACARIVVDEMNLTSMLDVTFSPAADDLSRVKESPENEPATISGFSEITWEGVNGRCVARKKRASVVHLLRDDVE